MNSLMPVSHELPATYGAVAIRGYETERVDLRELLGVFLRRAWLALASGAGVFAVVLAIVLHMGRLRPKPLWLTSTPAVILTTYAILMWLQTPWALAPDEHLFGSTIYAKSLLTFWMVYRIVDSKERLRDLLFALVLGCAVLGLYAQFTGREGNRLDGVGGPGIDDANSLGMYLATGAIVAVGLVLSQRGWLRYVTLAALVIIANGVVLANSRGSVIGLAAGFLALMIVKARAHRRLFWAFAAAAAIGQATIVDQAFIDRLFTIQDITADLNDKDADNSALSRAALAPAQIKMFKDHPMGVGHRGTAALSPEYLEDRFMSQGDDFIRQRSSHNTFLTTLVEQGYPDLVVNTWFGMIVPAGVPRDIVAKLNREINTALALPDVREKILATGLLPVGGSAEQFDALIRSEMERWAKVIKARGIKAE